MSPLSADSIFVGNPLVEAIGWENVRVDGDRASVYIGLRCSAVVEEMQMFGKVLSIARNPRAVLGRIGLYPEVYVSPCHHCAASLEGGMVFDFACWSHATVIIEEQPAGWLYAIEFLDVFGDTIHKICLTPESNFGAFLDWVDIHQSARPAQAPWGGRAQAGEQTLQEIGGNVMLLKAVAVRALIDEVLAQKRAVRACIGNLGLVSSGDFAPLSLQENGRWIFLNSDACGLHLEMESIGDVFLHQPPLAAPEPAWILRACDEEGGLICSFQPPRGESIPEWNHFLRDTCHPHKVTTIQS